MAFEAFVAAGRARGDRARRVGLMVSLALHLPPVALFALQLVVRPVLVERIEEPPGAAPVVPVRIAGLFARPRALVEPAPPEPRVLREAAPRKRAGHTPASSPVSRRPPALELAKGGAVLVREPVAPPAEVADLERAAAAFRSAILGPTADLPAQPGDPEGALIPGPAQELSAGAAAYLRTYETFPSLPDGSWSWTRRTYVFHLQVCVTESGQVDDVVMQRGTRPDLDAHLSRAVRTWRYRPWIVSGSARPFCHPMRITYSRG